MKRLIDRLAKEHRLSPEEYYRLFTDSEEDVWQYLRQKAQEIARQHFGNSIYIRGLIEISNCCKNDCYYCGIRRSNTHLKRYRLSRDAILDCCEQGYGIGFKTFVLQGGEDPALSDKEMEETIRTIRQHYPECAITLSIGEKTRETYERFFRAGANRYLLRHETFQKEHYNLLHPENMSHENRIKCLYDLKEIGYQTGTGIMVGSPYQTVENIIADLLFIERFKPQMIGIGPFIPHCHTPLRDFPNGPVKQTLKLISIFRLMHPAALIPATTALATLTEEGHQQGILAGANVIMPNLSPKEKRKEYELYNNKAFTGTEAAEGIEMLRLQMKAIGYDISYERGDYKD